MYSHFSLLFLPLSHHFSLQLAVSLTFSGPLSLNFPFTFSLLLPPVIQIDIYEKLGLVLFFPFPLQLKQKTSTNRKITNVHNLTLSNSADGSSWPEENILFFNSSISSFSLCRSFASTSASLTRSDKRFWSKGPLGISNCEERELGNCIKCLLVVFYIISFVIVIFKELFQSFGVSFPFLLFQSLFFSFLFIFFRFSSFTSFPRSNKRNTYLLMLLIIRDL